MYTYTDFFSIDFSLSRSNYCALATLHFRTCVSREFNKIINLRNWKP